MNSENGNHTWKLGEWYHEDEIELCSKGFHACKKPHEVLKFIYGNRLFIVEARGKTIYSRKGDKKFVSTDMRLVKELPLKEISVKFACACARDCLKNYEKEYPNDKRISKAIQAAEDYISGKISLDELNAARSAARSAAMSAA